MQNSKIIVSVVMPLYNEGRYIDNCIKSLILQDYPKEFMEWIFVDGMSQDKTVSIIETYKAEYPDLIKVLCNPHKTVPYAMNIGIQAACGKYIIRLDAHADYADNYISKCVYYLDTTDADNVGGVAETKARSKFGNTIAKMLSSPFGVGNSQFRIHGKSGYVDTVPFGAFRREVFEKYGGYDERLTRNQDNEMNYRIRKNGGKIFMADDIHLTYYCRDTVKGICNMAFQNGKWNVITMRFVPGSMGVRHFVPLAFLLSLIFLIIGTCFWLILGVLLGLEMVLYLTCDAFFSSRAASGAGEFFALMFLHLAFHITYGFGSLVGLFTRVK